MELYTPVFLHQPVFTRCSTISSSLDRWRKTDVSSFDYFLQLRISDVSYEERDDVYGELEARGLSGDSLRKLPCYIMSSEMAKRQITHCTICLQVLSFSICFTRID